ncbi:Uncharacterised conserved protein UCP030820 [Rhodopseudomonas palustris HaA2]|uniref:Uncharacterized conserved protein UCP030820 n=1 Tax=Rhodopseudomonas palustris (strain HaA2) TaxID=316058 RepID=Q2J098_RHOP2|nr:DUF934 domain-containing protein [Rhodopseudomonas palustris]ABD06112.1 Uncharacterised conserved protein UCP030820 [Rhodopseudomonas palustris HaA2]
MPLVKHGAIVADDYVAVADDADLPAGGAVLVSAARLFAEAETLAMRNTPVGVAWPNNRDVAGLVPWLDQLSLIALVFPTFKDGRAHSQGRRLREIYGYRGELRATGQVLRDQFTFLLRNGFDAFAVTKESDAQAFGEATHRYTEFYQPTGDGHLSALQLRKQRHKAVAT